MRGKPGVARQVKVEFDLYAFLSRWARTVLQFAGAAFILSLGYILFGIFSGALVKTGLSPDEFNAFIAADIAKWRGVRDQAG
ncbi:MAG: hypothetical protein WCP21_09225, partial [Armatimonadota bacterium]